MESEMDEYWVIPIPIGGDAPSEQLEDKLRQAAKNRFVFAGMNDKVVVMCRKANANLGEQTNVSF
jgi:hypothetical protein